MSRDLTDSNIAELYALNSTNVDLMLLRVFYNDETLYFIRNFIDVVFEGNTYQAIGFDLTLPDDVDTNQGNAELSIADVTGDVYSIVRLYDELKCEFQLISQNNLGELTSIASFQNFRLSSATWDDVQVSFTLARDDESIYNFPKNTMDNILFPSLY